MNQLKKRLESFIGSEEYTNTSIEYDMNAIKIRLHQNKSKSKYISFYIYPSWRITLNNETLNSSENCPYRGEGETQMDYKIRFTKYCKTTKLLGKVPIKKVKINEKPNSLSIVWENGATLESSSFSSNEYAYHI